MKKSILILIAALLVCVIFNIYIVTKGRDGVMGSIIESQEYTATTTAYFEGGHGNTRSDWIIKNGRGSLGSVIFTGGGDMAFNLYNATTTVAGNRPAKRQATSSILLASFSSNASSTTYVIDTNFSDGLLLDPISGTRASSTITFR